MLGRQSLVLLPKIRQNKIMTSSLLNQHLCRFFLCLFMPESGIGVPLATRFFFENAHEDILVATLPSHATHTNNQNFLSSFSFEFTVIVATIKILLKFCSLYPSNAVLFTTGKRNKLFNILFAFYFCHSNPFG